MSELLKIDEKTILEIIGKHYGVSSMNVCLNTDYTFIMRGNDKVREDYIYGIVQTEGNRPMTNRERLAKMTDEELAEFLCNLVPESKDCAMCLATKTCKGGHTGFIDWLKAEAEEEE